MTEQYLPGTPPVPLRMRRSGRARRISLRVSQLDGRVTLTIPPGVPDSEALAFARSRQNWIRSHLAAHPEPEKIGIGALIPIEGRNRIVVAAPGRRVELRESEIAVPEVSAASRLSAFLRELARDRLAAASDQYAGLLQIPYQRLTLRDTRSRWGSCSSAGGLMFSWRLILAPSDVLRYVAAHEVSHLKEMNHSPAFWATVTKLYGDYDAPRDWLRQNGALLHRYRL